MRYKPEIDGLRALAVTPVVFYHSGLGFPGGFVGVDVFFVISGYLITRILNDEMDFGSFSLLNFYERRARRILPALLAVLMITTAAAFYVLLAPELSHYAGSLLATLLFASNFWFWRRGGDYFAQDVELEPLLHTWSLAVEEQFYIFFPLLLLILRRLMPRHLVAAIFGLVAASFVLSIFAVSDEPVAAFYLIPTRAWELGVGSLLALIQLPSFRQWVLEAVAIVGATCVIAPVFLYSDGTPFPGVSAAVPVLGSAMLIGVSACGRTAVTNALAQPLLVGVGLISYSLYLWHWPVIVFAKIVLAADQFEPPAQFAVVGSSLVMAWLSWRFVERPFRSRIAVGRRQIFSYAGLASGAVAAAGLAINAGQGFPNRFGPETRRIAAAATDLVPCPGTPMETGYCLLGNPAREPTYLVWGDSHALIMGPAIAAAGRAKGATGVLASHNSCPPLLGVVRPERPECFNSNARVIDYLRSHPSITRVILIARWPQWRSGERAPGEHRPKARIFDKHDVRQIEPAPSVFDRALTRSIRALDGMGKHVVLIGDVPEIGWDVPSHMVSEQRFGIETPAPPSKRAVLMRQMPANAVLANLAKSVDGEFLDPLPLLCAQDHCEVAYRGVPIYKDDNHLTAYASVRYLTPLFAHSLP